MPVEDKSTRDVKLWEAVEDASELIMEDRYPEAMLLLRDVIKANPNNHYAYFWLGVAFFETKQLPAARDAYRAAVRLSGDYLGARVSLSHVLRQLGDIKGALAQANEALRRFPKDGEAKHAAGLAHAALGERGAAKKHLQGFLDSKPEVEAATEVQQILDMLGLGPEGEPLEIE